MRSSTDSEDDLIKTAHFAFRCFEEKSRGKDVGIRGILNSQNCQNTIAPILYSLPHFLNADPEIRERLSGLQPSQSKHNFYLDVYPALGFVINMRIRVQVNFRLKKVVGNARDSKIQEIIYPVFWQEWVSRFVSLFRATHGRQNCYFAGLGSVDASRE